MFWHAAREHPKWHGLTNAYPFDGHLARQVLACVTMQEFFLFRFLRAYSNANLRVLRNGGASADKGRQGKVICCAFFLSLQNLCQLSWCEGDPGEHLRINTNSTTCNPAALNVWHRPHAMWTPRLRSYLNSKTNIVKRINKLTFSISNLSPWNERIFHWFKQILVDMLGIASRVNTRLEFQWVFLGGIKQMAIKSWISSLNKSKSRKRCEWNSIVAFCTPTCLAQLSSVQDLFVRDNLTWEGARHSATAQQ